MMIGEKQRCSEALERIRGEFLRSGDSIKALAERSRFVDELVCETWKELMPAETGMTLLAVGGYGRRQLFPYSDVDLLLLFESDRTAETARASISSFLQRLWDANLRVSHSVRTPGECSELHDRNIELNVSLLDQRFLTGDQALYARLMEKLPRFIHAQREALVRNLGNLTRDRHEKFQHTYYHLEPDIKETPGGMRDYQLVCWLDQVRRTTPQRAANRESFPELDEAVRFLSFLRCHLHFLAGRDNNVFNFDAQESVDSADPAGLMRVYFRHARTVHRAAARLLESSQASASNLFSQFRDWRSRLSNADFTVSRERVHFRAAQQLDVDPDLLLRLFKFVGRHGIRLSLEAEQRVEARLPAIAAYYAEPRPLWPALAELLALPHAALALRAMHETGVLRAIFPEFAQIECLVIRDFYHRYTVDEHTLVTIQALGDLRESADPLRRRYAEILSELDNPAVVMFALLFHDIGKASADEGHVDASLRVVEGAMRRIGMPEADRDMVRFLIRCHLDMSEVMQSRDMLDPATAQFMAHQVGTVERLKGLTLVTFADISAVNPGAMTPWRAEQLWTLYLMAYQELTRELDAERIESPTPELAEYAAFLDGFPTRYLRTHSASEVASHAQLEESSRKRGVAADLAKTDAGYRLTLVTGDRPFLFASIAGTLASFGMNILKAEAFGNRRGTVLDTFMFEDPRRTLELNPSEVDRLRGVLERVVLGKQDVKQLLQNRPKPSAPSRKSRIEGRVSFDPDASSTATLIQIVAQDRPGLLYDLASAISGGGCNIEVVLIDTEAHKAIDVFYVSSDGRKLTGDQQAALGEALREACR